LLVRKRGTHSLPPRSPDFFYYFFWRFVKGVVYHEKVQNINEIRDRIVRSAECITNEVLASTWQEAECCLDVCSANGVAHIAMG